MLGVKPEVSTGLKNIALRLELHPHMVRSKWLRNQLLL